MNDETATEKLAAELAKHQVLVGPREEARPATWFRWCVCGWDGGPLASGEASNDNRSYRAHLAAALLPVVREIAADELRAAADQIDRGPTFSLPPSVISALVRERADALA